ncbi:ABC transporter permease [Conexibacter stalactiti]|uniref:ABC transporter permease n=1 Tax=Conexibacter stalactiti TaxID=1940611 RepID=A0ABU4HNE0_9ACTN|nr:ABC transporter permease [Conexibacter stalactiti]MDW5594831.1 ABC transporter permease [Conexibacter stalactiti]MEC5035473.1 ABC transporter permease [Conexibacter stalactiti]
MTGFPRRGRRLAATPGAGALLLAAPRRGWLARLGWLERTAIGLLLLVTVVAILAPLLAPHDPVATSTTPFLPPGSPGAPLGSDELGRDVLSRVIHGVRASWLATLLVVSVSVVIGGTIGVVAGMRGGWVDNLLMRITEIGLALPGPMLAIAVIVALGPSLRNTLLAVIAVWWPWYARLVRGEARALVVRPHVEAARVAGVGGVRLALRHVVPGVLPAVLVTASVDLGALVLALAGLSFIGLGAPPPAPELGAMASQGLSYLFGQAWICLAPAVALFVLAFSANVAGDGLRDLLEDV